MAEGGEPEPARNRARIFLGAKSDAAPLAALLLVLALQASLIVLRGIHWDEFHFYGQVHSFLQDEPLRPLQTLHVRLFAWLPALPGDSIEHIQVGRTAMFACELITTAAIFGLARQFADARTGILAALLYVSAGYVFQHGFAFRTDPLAAAPLMLALWMLASRPLHAMTLLCSAALIGFAGMVTIKAALIAPAFAGVAWMRFVNGSPRTHVAAKLALVGIGAVTAFLGFYAWHRAGLVLDQTRPASEMATGAAERMFSRGLLPQWPYFLQSVLLAPVLFLAVALAPRAIWRERRASPRNLALAGLWLPVLVPMFYRNSFPYFYAFILPPVAVAAAVAGLKPIRARFSDALIAALLAMLTLGFWALEPRGIVANQRAVIGAARAIFPAGTAYFDYSDMLAPFPKANFFMTTWGYQAYLESDRRDLVNEIARRPVPLVLANHVLLEKALETPDVPGPQLKAHDIAALRGNYVHHWGPFWVAGHTIPAGAKPMVLLARVPGTYTVEGAAVKLDGAVYRPGETLVLAQGRHVAENTSAATSVLRWGDHLAMPNTPAPTGDILRGF